jgi:prepilin-type N-terminal cleavage/methylation domain-containing protein
MKIFVKSGFLRRTRRASAAAGMSIIELMIAMTILAIAMLASMVMVMIGMQTDNSSKTDSTATILDQEIIEKYATLKNYPKPVTVNIWDCALNGGSANLHLADLGSGALPAGNGAVVYQASPPAPTAVEVGDIDWTSPAPVFATAVTPGYAMLYQTCSGDLYEVRWNIAQLSPVRSLLTVSARPRAAQVFTAGASQTRAVLFARPVTLRTMIVN